MSDRAGNSVVAEVVPLASADSIDAAWNAYTDFAKMLCDDPDKLCDRAFHEEFTRRYARWRRLYLMTEHCG